MLSVKQPTTDQRQRETIQGFKGQRHIRVGDVLLSRYGTGGLITERRSTRTDIQKHSGYTVF